MKSGNKGITRREVFNKYVRAKAHREGILFKEALSNVATTENGTGAFVPVIAGRERTDTKRLEIRERLRVERIVKAPARDSAARSLVIDKEYDAHSEILPAHRHTNITVPIMSIARPAKRKGANKDFEIVGGIRNVIALAEESSRTLPGDDDWEHIYDEEATDSRPSYSSVLRRTDR